MPPDAARPTLRQAQDRFIAAWGQMGGTWGISRTMAEVHALLFITGEPLCTDEVMERLEISRGNASMSLRALLDWGIVVRTHKRGDRKEYFAAEQDVWAMFRAILRERMKREVDPLLASLHEIRDAVRPARAARAGEGAEPGAEGLTRRLDDLLNFLEVAEALSARFAAPSGAGLQAAATALSSAGAQGRERARGRPTV